MSLSTESNNLLDIQMNEEIKSGFTGLSQWANYSAIIGFISAGMSLVTAISVLSSGGSASGSSNILGTIIGLVISIFLNLTLLASAKFIRQGVAASDQGTFNQGLSKLAQYFKVIGILAIIGLVFFVLALLVIMISAGIAR